jgi:hypothetical protein
MLPSNEDRGTIHGWASGGIIFASGLIQSRLARRSRFSAPYHANQLHANGVPNLIIPGVLRIVSVNIFNGKMNQSNEASRTPAQTNLRT